MTQCGGNWPCPAGTASASQFADCSTFLSSDLACLEDTPYAERLCLASSLLWNGTRRTFAVSTEECLKQQPLFVSQPYLLHYSPKAQFVGDAELSARWVMSE